MCVSIHWEAIGRPLLGKWQNLGILYLLFIQIQAFLLNTS